MKPVYPPPSPPTPPSHPSRDRFPLFTYFPNGSGIFMKVSWRALYMYGLRAINCYINYKGAWCVLISVPPKKKEQKWGHFIFTTLTFPDIFAYVKRDKSQLISQLIPRYREDTGDIISFNVTRTSSIDVDWWTLAAASLRVSWICEPITLISHANLLWAESHVARIIARKHRARSLPIPRRWFVDAHRHRREGERGR